MSEADQQSPLRGVYAPICTPFRKNEAVDLEALDANMARYADTNLKGYLALGSNGENKALTEEEKLLVLRHVVGGAGPEQIVMAGATYEAQRDTERFLREAADIGAHFGVVLAPSYFRNQMTDDILYRYYATLADTSPIPILIYNAPKFCGMALSAELIGRLAPHPNIVGMKDSGSGSYESFLDAASDGFEVMAGSISFLFPAMMAGAVGGTLSLANSFPSFACRLFELGMARDTVEGPKAQAWLKRVNAGISGKFGVAGVKAAMDLGGYTGGYPRRPLLPLTEEERGQLSAFLTEEGILDQHLVAMR